MSFGEIARIKGLVSRKEGWAAWAAPCKIELERRGGELGMAVGRVPNAHSQGQSLDPLCAENTKQEALCCQDKGPLSVLWQLNFQRPRGKRCPSLSAPSNRPKRHKDTLWTWQKLDHPCFHSNLKSLTVTMCWRCQSEKHNQDPLKLYLFS